MHMCARRDQHCGRDPYFMASGLYPAYLIKIQVRPCRLKPCLIVQTDYLSHIHSPTVARPPRVEPQANVNVDEWPATGWPSGVEEAMGPADPSESSHGASRTWTRESSRSTGRGHLQCSPNMYLLCQEEDGEA